MNIPGIRFIVPLLCGLLLLAVPSSNAKEPEKAKPSPTSKSKGSSAVVSIGKLGRVESVAASPTPKPNAEKSHAPAAPQAAEAASKKAKTEPARTAASPTPKAK